MENEFSGYNGARPQQGQGLMPEVSGNTGMVGGGQAAQLGGLYRHPLAKDKDGNPVEIVTFVDPKLGDGQSRAALRAGFEYVGPAPEGYVKEMGVASLENTPGVGTQGEDLKGILARLNALEAENARLKGAQSENSEEQSFKELQELAKDLGVSAKGSREELLERITEARLKKGNE